MKTKFYLLVLCCSIIATATVWSQDNPFTLSADGKILEKWTGTDPTADMTAYPELENVVKIAGGAFNGIETLKKVIISKNVTTFEGYYFAGTPLDSVGVASGNGYYSDIDGVLFNWGKTYLFYYPRGKTATSYEVPSTVTHIANIAFYQQKNLKEITLPAGLNAITIDQAFFGATNLETINNFEQGQVTVIPTSTFSDCWNLKSITLPATITEIQDKAFYNTSALTTIKSLNPTPPTLGNNIFDIGETWLPTPTRTLYVPKGSKSTYQTAWGDKFTGTIEEAPSSTNKLKDRSDMKVWIKDNKFRVEGDACGSELSFNIFNSTGQLVQSLSNLSESIDQNLKGLYIVRVKRAGEAIKSFKIIL